MKKIKWAVILIAALSIIFAGCTGPFDPDTKANPVAAGKKYLSITSRTQGYFTVDVLTGDGTAKSNMKVGDVITVWATCGGNFWIASVNSDSAQPALTGSTSKPDKGATMWSAKLEAIPAQAPNRLRIAAGANNDLVIYEIEVTRDDDVIYTLSTDEEFQALPKGVDTAIGNPTKGLTWLTKAGNPVITIIQP